MTEKELIGLYKNEGNLEARELLVSKYYKFVISNLRKLVRYDFPYAALEKEDYLSITYECIISIGLKYDLADTKLSFREYLYTNIKYTLLRLIKPFMHGCSVLITSNKSGASKWHYENDSISFEDTFYARAEKEEQRRLLDKGLSLATAKTRSIVLLKASGLNDIAIARALKVRVKSCSNKFWMFVRRFKLMFVRTAI